MAKSLTGGTKNELKLGSENGKALSVLCVLCGAGEGG